MAFPSRFSIHGQPPKLMRDDMISENAANLQQDLKWLKNSVAGQLLMHFEQAVITL
jgi:hypothetical protein